MEISVIGISHRTARVELREQFSLPDGTARKFLRAVGAEDVLEEAMVLDTCNRTEILLAAETHADLMSYVLGHVARVKGTEAAADTSAFYRHDGTEAVKHLFRVAAALDSQIVGEHEILGQIKRAYRLALDERGPRFLLNRLLHRAMRVGKRVQTETQLGRGAAGIAKAAVELAEQIFSSLAGKTVLLIGAGQTGRSAARAILRSGAAGVVVANRTQARAQQVADELLGGSSEAGEPATACLSVRAVTLEDLPSVIAEVDVVISATASPELVLTSGNVGGVLLRGGRPVLVVDIAVPRDVDERLAELPNVFVHNIDDLDALVARDIERRRDQIPRAEAIVDYEVRQFCKWLGTLRVAPTIRLLGKYVDQLRQGEIKRYGRRFDDRRDELDRFTRGLCGKLLHGPVAFLRELAAKSGASERMAGVDAVRRMFDLDSLEDEA